MSRGPELGSMVSEGVEDTPTYIDYKDVDMLRRFISDRGKILPKRVTGTKSRYQA